MGVTSAIKVILNPIVFRALRAASRPAPGPFIKTSTSRKPVSQAFRPTFSTAAEAAYGVALRAPLKPDAPELLA